MNSLVERLKERGAFLHAGAAWGFDPDGYLMEQAAKEIERVEAAYERAHRQCNDALNEAARLKSERDSWKKHAAQNWKAYDRAEDERRHHARLSYQYMKDAERAEAQRDEQKRRADALERMSNGKTQTINTLVQLAEGYVALEDAKAACSATGEQVNEARQDLLDECSAALTDQPAQSGPWTKADHEAEARHYDQHGCPEEDELHRQRARGEQEESQAAFEMTKEDEQLLAELGLGCADQPADGERLDPYTQGYSDGYLEGFERGMQHAPPTNT